MPRTSDCQTLGRNDESSVTKLVGRVRHDRGRNNVDTVVFLIFVSGRTTIRRHQSARFYVLRNTANYSDRRSYNGNGKPSRPSFGDACANTSDGLVGPKAVGTPSWDYVSCRRSRLPYEKRPNRIPFASTAFSYGNR